MIYGHVETHFPTRPEESRRVLHLRPARLTTGEPPQVLYDSLEQLQEDLAHVDAVRFAFAGSHDTFVHVDQAAPLLRTLWQDWGAREARASPPGIPS